MYINRLYQALVLVQSRAPEVATCCRLSSASLSNVREEETESIIGGWHTDTILLGILSSGAGVIISVIMRPECQGTQGR